MQAVERILIAIGHYSQLEQNQENEMALQELKLAVHQLQANNAEQQQLRSALTVATDTLERELLPALEDKDPLAELIEGFRTVAGLNSEALPDSGLTSCPTCGVEEGTYIGPPSNLLLECKGCKKHWILSRALYNASFVDDSDWDVILKSNFDVSRLQPDLDNVLTRQYELYRMAVAVFVEHRKDVVCDLFELADEFDSTAGLVKSAVADLKTYLPQSWGQTD